MGRITSKKWLTVCLLLVLCCRGTPVLVVAEETGARSEKQGQNAPESNFADSLSMSSRREPIHITSRTLEFLYEEKKIIYRTDVVAVQGDVTIRSDLLTVMYEDTPPVVTSGKKETSGRDGTLAQPENGGSRAAKQRLKEIIAEGKVEIISGDRHATGKKAVFDEGKRIVTLSGDAVLKEGENQVLGERVTVYLDEKRSVVDGGGGSGRVKMLLIPGQNGDERKEAKKP